MTDFWTIYTSSFWHWAEITFGGILALQVICNTIAIVYNRTLRSRNIRDRGWPTNPLMDADGDIVHPKHPEAK